MGENNPFFQEKKEKKQKAFDTRLFDKSKADEMEEFALKVKVDLEDAMSGRRDYLSILEEAYSQAEKTEKDYKEKFREFRLEAKSTEDIYMVSCFTNSGNPLFHYLLSKTINYQDSVSLILNTITHYTHNLGELLEDLSLESQTFHFFIVEELFIVAIVTSKHVHRDKITSLSFQVCQILKQYPNKDIQSNQELRAAIDRAIESIKATLVQEHHTLKVILIGDGAVGKTSIRRRYLGEGFKIDYQMTIGADLAAKTSDLVYAGGKQIKYLIWDLAGQPRFSNVRKIYYMSAVGALVVFDMTRPESFQNIVKWMNELWRNNGRGPVPLIVLGNKVDLREVGMPCVSEKKVQAFVARLSHVSEQYRGFKIHYLPTSAKTGQNIEQAFELLGEAILDFLTSVKTPRGR
ncbi:MAG: Rab family GTPase [Promethearchaeota archaeon]